MPSSLQVPMRAPKKRAHHRPRETPTRHRAPSLPWVSQTTLMPAASGHHSPRTSLSSTHGSSLAVGIRSDHSVLVTLHGRRVPAIWPNPATSEIIRRNRAIRMVTVITTMAQCPNLSGSSRWATVASGQNHPRRLPSAPAAIQERAHLIRWHPTMCHSPMIMG